MARAIAPKTGEDEARVLHEHRQVLGVGLRRANARVIFRRQSTPADPLDTQMAAELALVD